MTAARADDAPLCLPPRPLQRLPRQSLPTGTIDCHFHVFAPDVPLTTPRSYTPQIVGLADWLHYADAVGIARGVAIQPSVYGFDNTALLSALAAEPDRLRGIAVVAPEVTAAELERLHAAGVRGIRINTRNKGGLAFDTVHDFMRNVAPFGWSVQFQVAPEQLADIGELAADSPAALVIDHLGFIALAGPESGKQLSDLQRALDRKRCHVKISAPYRLSGVAAAFANAVATLTRSHPEKLLWGSDWPHTELWSDVPDDAEMIERALGWFANTAARNAAFVTNAARLFWIEG